MKAIYLWVPVLVLLCLAFSDYVLSGLIGMTLAVVAYPLHRTLRTFARSPRGLMLKPFQARNVSALLTECVVLAAVVVGLVLPLLVLYMNRGMLVSHTLVLYGQTMDWSHARMNALGQRLVGGLHTATPGHETGLPAASPVDELRRLLCDPASLLPMAIHTVSSLAVLAVHLMVLLLIMHVSLLNGPDFWEHLLESTPPTWVVIVQKMGQRATEVLRAAYVVQGLTALAAFLIALPVFWIILGSPHFFLAAVLCGLSQLLPFLGSSVLVAAMVVYFFLQGQDLRGWECLFIALPLVSGVVDLLIRPALARSQGHISGVTMLIGFVAGMETFGLAGFVLGPLLLELFVCFTAIMLYGPEYNKDAYLFPPRAGLDKME